MQNLIINITQENFDLLLRDDLVCFLLPDTLGENFIIEFVKRARNKAKLCLIYGEKAEEKYQKYGADGVVLDLSREEKPQRLLKEFKDKNREALVGAISRNRRHEAMLISECEPEFIIFRLWKDGGEKTAELLKWYSDFFLIQCAVWPQEPLNYASSFADFVIIDSSSV